MNFIHTERAEMIRGRSVPSQLLRSKRLPQTVGRAFLEYCVRFLPRQTVIRASRYSGISG
jgi:hypothetical protein